MKNRNTNRKPKTHDEIEDAISSFLKHGGKIKQLEAQQNETLNLDSIEEAGLKLKLRIEDFEIRIDNLDLRINFSAGC